MECGRNISLYNFDDTYKAQTSDRRPFPGIYRRLLAFIFAVDEINRSPDILPNVTLGYHVYDSCNNVNKAIESILQILSGPGDLIPNFSCLDSEKLAGVIFHPSAERSLHIVQILNLYGYTQIICGPSYPVLTNENIYPSFFQTLPCDQTQSLAIVKLLIHFRWTWIGVIASDDDAGDKQNQELRKVADSYNICIEFSIKIPVSVCSSDCLAGHRRVQNPEMPLCCFYCVHCPRGEISNVTDKGSCQKCPEDQWPNDYDQCVPKPVEYLSYTNTPVTLAIFVITGLFFSITLVISLIFYIYRGTPVIRANNRDLSLVLLVSIMLSFLSVFLFLGRPVHITCMLRHTVYGVLFSVAVSSILAKTVIVYMSFKATKPGNAWKKFIGVKIPMCLVLICSFFQIVTSVIWLSVSPPFPEANTDLYLDRIIIQCNEGSILAFAILLGYLGLLAAVSFIVAFLARNLPDGFNEAKYITFSMLVFCSVWITFIPAYLSVTGMNTMLVEIFAIISSSAGILGFIFFPKCYIVLVRPDLNSKSIILKQICHR
ncbi:vomeronasal type-2 receptor 26-like [Mantella aurantiaca]